LRPFRRDTRLSAIVGVAGGSSLETEISFRICGGIARGGFCGLGLAAILAVAAALAVIATAPLAVIAATAPVAVISSAISSAIASTIATTVSAATVSATAIVKADQRAGAVWPLDAHPVQQFQLEE
jgi:hypothetical protein